jgi:hypothetical protein
LTAIERRSPLAEIPLLSDAAACLSVHPSRRNACLAAVPRRKLGTAATPRGAVEACSSLSPTAAHKLISNFAKTLGARSGALPIAKFGVSIGNPPSCVDVLRLIAAEGAIRVAASFVMDSALAFGARDWETLRVVVVRADGRSAIIRVAGSRRTVATVTVNGSWRIETLHISAGRVPP